MPERDLWQEVLLRQIADARLNPADWPVPERAYDETAAARAYLTTPSDGLALVCSLAGVEVVALLERMRRRVAVAPPVVPVHRHIGRPPRPKDAPAEGPRTITHAGHTLTVRQWSEGTGLSTFTIRDRLNKGWQVEEVLRPGDLRGVHMKVEAA